MVYAIRFDYPEGKMYAGKAPDGALGWAPTLKTALLFAHTDSALNTIKNGYGEESQKWAKVVEVKESL